MNRRAIALGAAAGLLLAWAVASASGGSSGAPITGADLYEMVASAAARGDSQAQEQLAAIDAYMKAHDLQPSSLGLPSGERKDAAWSNSLVALSLEDYGPFSIDISNDTQFSSADQVTAYRAVRHAALDAMAASAPGREIEVAISPNGRRSVSEVAAAIGPEAIGMRLIVDVYAPEGWLMTAGMGIEGRKFASEAAAIDDEVLDIASLPLDQFPGITRKDLRAEVRILYVRMPAASAQAASRTPEVILAVDALTDIKDAFAGRAAIIEVENAPELREVQARLVLGHPVDEDRVEPTANSTSR